MTSEMICVVEKMTKHSVAMALVGVVVLSACAQKADNIAPAAMSSVRYDAWSCSQLGRERAHIDEALPRVSAQQDSAATQDAVMVFLIGVPTSGGGVPGEVARLKGEQEAVRRAMVEKRC